MTAVSCVKASRVIFDELWQVHDPEPHEGAWNMAMDEALLRHATRPLLRIYRWSRPAVSFGYFGKWEDAARACPGRELVRRWRGGGIVPHGEDLTYTLVVPRGEALLQGGASESYRRVHEAVVAALDGMDRAEKFTLATGSPKLSDACFENPVPHDVLAGGEKIAGAAQRRSREGMLHQGSIQRSGLGEEFAARLAKSLARVVQAREISAEERAEAERLVAEKYGAAEWLRRR